MFKIKKKSLSEPERIPEQRTSMWVRKENKDIFIIYIIKYKNIE